MLVSLDHNRLEVGIRDDLSPEGFVRKDEAVNLIAFEVWEYDE